LCCLLVLGGLACGQGTFGLTGSDLPAGAPSDRSFDGGDSSASADVGGTSGDEALPVGDDTPRGGGDTPPAGCPAGSKDGGATGGTLTAAGGINVLVRTPPGYSPTVAYPFVMVYAPAGADAAGCEAFTGLTTQARARGYIIAYADNVGPESLEVIEQAAGTIPAVTARWCVDPKRIYVTGHSNGGTLAEVIGAQGFAPVAAIAPSAAGMKSSTFTSLGCPAAPLPEMEMHSSGDQLFPLSEGFGAHIAEMWAAFDGCSPTPGDADANGCIHYTGCAGNAEVDYCEGTAPHGVWPHLNDAIFDFFARFVGP